jgi:hypothetical protein
LSISLQARFIIVSNLRIFFIQTIPYFVKVYLLISSFAQKVIKQGIQIIFITNTIFMKIKLFAFILIFTVLAPQIFAQKRRKTNNEISIGLLGGIDIQNLYGTNSNGEKLNYNLMVGFHAGANMNLRFGPDLFIQPGLLFSLKGAKQEILTDMIRTTKFYYIEIPLNIIYRPQVGDGHILIGAGPYGAYGIKGEEIDAAYGTIPVKFLNKADLNNDDFRYYKPFDGGINLLFGYDLYNGIFIHLNTQLGLLKINSFYIEDKASKKNIGSGLSVGYRF